MSCCPSGSWGHLAPDAEYKEKGVVETLERNLPVYRVGVAKSGRCIVWNYDIHGFHGGRTRQLCDWIAEKGNISYLNWWSGIRMWYATLAVMPSF